MGFQREVPSPGCLRSPVLLTSNRVFVRPGSDEAILGVYRLGACFLAGGGLFALLMAAKEPDLSPRERGAAAVAGSATVALGVRGAFDTPWFERFTRERRLASGLPWAGTASTWLSRPDRSPMMFPAMFLTAVGTARVGGRAGKSIGAVAAGLYAVGVGVSRRRDPDRSLWWNASMTAGFYSGGTISPLLMRLAFQARSLAHARERDRQLVDMSVPSVAVLHGRAKDLAAEAKNLDIALARLQAVELPTPAAQAQLTQAAEQSRAHALPYLLAPILTRAARGEELDLQRTLQEVIAAHRQVRPGLAITWTSTVAAGFAVDGRATAALVKALQNTLANAAVHGGTSLTTIAVTLDDDGVYTFLTVEDDGGGVEPAVLGSGLAGVRNSCNQLQGDLEFSQGAGGLRVTAYVRRTRSRSTAEQFGSVLERVDATLAQVARIQTASCYLQGLGSLATARSGRAAAACAAVFTGLTISNYLREARRDQSPWKAAAHVGAMGLLWPAGGRPPAGLSGNAVLLYGITQPRRAAIPTATLVAAHVLSAGRIRDTVSVGRLVEHIAFPAFCGTMGAVGGAFGRSRMEAVEQETGSLRDRADMVEQVAAAGGLVHDLVKPLRAVPGWFEDIRHRPEAEEFVDLAERVSTLMRDITLRVQPVDPIAEFQRYLATVLGPAEISVEGHLPRPPAGSQTAESSGPKGDDRLEDDLAAQRARSSMNLIALADEVAADILDAYPINAKGHWTLERVQITVAPKGDSKIELVVQPLPVRISDGRNVDRMVAAVSRFYGAELQEGFGDARTAFLLPTNALVAHGAT